MIYKRITNALLLFVIALFIVLLFPSASNFVEFLLLNTLFTMVGIAFVNYIVLGRFIIFHLKKSTSPENDLVEVPRFVKIITFTYMIFIVISCLYYMASPIQKCISSGGYERSCISQKSW
jgi:amino acid transporter